MITVTSADTVDISSLASKQSASTDVVQRQQHTAAEVVVSAIQSGNLQLIEKRKMKSTIGTRQVGLTGQLKAVRTKPRLDLIVTRLSSDTSMAELETYTSDILTGCCCVAVNDANVSCTKLTTKFTCYTISHCCSCVS